MEEFYDGLTPEQIRILNEQIERFNSFKGKEREEIIPSDKLVLPKGTLIHGTKFNIEMLKSIAKTGIITGQYFGIEEDGETFYCVDFHRVSKDTSLEEYNKEFSYKDGRCPFGNRGKSTIAFIIHPTNGLNGIGAYDCYREETKESEIVKSFVNLEGLPDYDKNKLSSILFGVPCSFINGIVVGDKLIDEEKIGMLKGLFPGCYMVRNNGEIIYRQKDNEEITSLRVAKIKAEIDKEEKQKEIESLNCKISQMTSDNEKLWYAIAGLSLENIAGVFKTIGYQGTEEDFLKYAKNLQERYNDIKEGMKR